MKPSPKMRTFLRHRRREERRQTPVRSEMEPVLAAFRAADAARDRGNHLAADALLAPYREWLVPEEAAS